MKIILYLAIWFLISVISGTLVGKCLALMAESYPVLNETNYAKQRTPTVKVKQRVKKNPKMKFYRNFKRKLERTI